MEKGIHSISIPVGKSTRTCTSLLCHDQNTMTELIEPSSLISSLELSALESHSLNLLQSNPDIRFIALCGTLPPGVNGSIYSLMCNHKPKGCWIFLDAVKEVECLDTGKVDILKVNAEEACCLAQIPWDDTLVVDLVQVGKVLLAKYDLTVLAITNGPDT